MDKSKPVEQDFRVCALIVTYFPSELLIENIRRISQQVDHILIVDNGSGESLDEVLSDLKVENLTIHRCGTNLGIATALNVGVKWARDRQYNWVLTLDQDSACNPDMVAKLKGAYLSATDRDRIAVLAPLHFDRETQYVSAELRTLKGPLVRRNYVMTSGNLIPMKMFDVIGMYDDEFFIEYVDHDFCLRAKRKGLDVVLVREARMAHRLGEMRLHSIGDYFGFFSHNYLPVRRYYRARNRVLLYWRYFGFWILQDIEFTFKDLIKIILVEDQKWLKIRAMLVGTVDGITRKMGPARLGIVAPAEASVEPKRSFFQRAFGLLQLFKSPTATRNYLKSLLQPGEFSHIRNSTLNLLGQVLPLVAGLVTMPLIVKGLGPERFSLLTVAWAALGYFTLFDLGFSRATTKVLAEILAESRKDEVASLFWSSNLSLLAISCLGALVLGVTAPMIIDTLKDVPEVFKAETRHSIILLAAAIPVMTLTANMRGVMEAQGRFFAINLIQLIVGVSSYIAPLFLLHHEDTLFKTVAALVAIRTISLVAHAVLNFRLLPEALKAIHFDKAQVIRLWSFGGWLTVSNIISPILFYFDRFALGILLPIKNVGYYTAPVESVMKLWIIPSSLTRVLFPEFASLLATDVDKVRRLYRRSVGALALSMAPPCLILIIGGEFVLRIWLGAEFAEHASTCLRILALGVWVNALAWVPFVFLQSLGRTKTIALIHSSELIPYILVFSILTSRMGIEGAAWAWTLRSAGDALLMFIYAQRGFHQKTAQLSFTQSPQGNI